MSRSVRPDRVLSFVDHMLSRCTDFDIWSCVIERPGKAISWKDTGNCDAELGKWNVASRSKALFFLLQAGHVLTIRW